MNTLSRRVLLLALLGSNLGFSAIGAAHASWRSCPDSTHVAYNPVTGNEIRVGVNPQIGQLPERPVYAWVCVDDGGIVGATSVGTASYVNNVGGYGSFIEHTVVCPPGPQPCTQSFAGAVVYPPAAGSVGVQPCVHPAVGDTVCASVGLTPGTVPVATGAPDTCVAVVASNCVGIPTVRIGGNVVTVYVGGSPTPVDVPVACVTVRPNAPFLRVPDC